MLLHQLIQVKCVSQAMNFISKPRFKQLNMCSKLLIKMYGQHNLVEFYYIELSVGNQILAGNLLHRLQLSSKEIDGRRVDVVFTCF